MRGRRARRRLARRNGLRDGVLDEILRCAQNDEAWGMAALRAGSWCSGVASGKAAASRRTPREAGGARAGVARRGRWRVGGGGAAVEVARRWRWRVALDAFVTTW